MTIYSNHDLKLMLLGGFEVHLNECPITKGFTYAKMRALLAYLVIEQKQEHSREALAALLWPDFDAAVARANLRRTLADLRRVLPVSADTALFTTSKHSIRFVSACYVDALDFNAQAQTLSNNTGEVYKNKERMIALYRGEFLSGLCLPDNPDFESWLQLQRGNLHCRALALLERLVNIYSQTGNFVKALHFALRHIELEPWNEVAHCRVMRLYALNGQTNAAISQYESCCRLLKNELDVLPSEETRRLISCIRNGELYRRFGDYVVDASTECIAPPLTERRQVTVLYCELTTGMIDDPDEALALLTRPQLRCADIIQQYSGYTVPSHGGGLLAYFGYPQAHENAARRAVQAALAVIREAVDGIQIRVTVHTGLITTHADLSMPDIAGMTTCFAIKLCHCTASGQVTISQQTHAMVAGYFDCISLGVKTLHGFAQPQELFNVRQENRAQTRLDAAVQLTPWIGRKAEMAELMALWEDARQGRHRIELVQGEPGIGKSRLLHTFKQRLVEPYIIREFRCFPEFSQSPFHPLIASFETILDFAHNDPPEEKFAKLVHYAATHYPALAQDAVPLLAQLLSLPIGAHYPVPDFSPQQQKHRLINILHTTLRALGEQHPVLFIVEDLHWIDPSTLELLTLIVEQTKSAAIFMLFTALPDFVPPWNKALASTLMLSPLLDVEAVEMITSISADIPVATVRSIVERADGVPLFVEEMAKIVTLDNHPSIPATLQDILAARMDAIGKAKYIGQFAATIGREFDVRLLSKIVTCDAAALAENLTTLQDTGLIMKLRDNLYQFKHTLIQESTYLSQTKVNRQAVHRRIAEVLLSDFPDIVSTQPELLARHFSAGGEIAQAIQYWLEAGQRALQNSANLEAAGHFEQSLKLVLTLPPDAERDRLQAEIQLKIESQDVDFRQADRW